jgi:hypothetical protein
MNEGRPKRCDTPDGAACRPGPDDLDLSLVAQPKRRDTPGGAACRLGLVLLDLLVELLQNRSEPGGWALGVLKAAVPPPPFQEDSGLELEPFLAAANFGAPQEFPLPFPLPFPPPKPPRPPPFPRKEPPRNE